MKNFSKNVLMTACQKKQDASKKAIKGNTIKTECTHAVIATLITETALTIARQDTARKNNFLFSKKLF